MVEIILEAISKTLNENKQLKNGRDCVLRKEILKHIIAETDSTLDNMTEFGELIKGDTINDVYYRLP